MPTIETSKTDAFSKQVIKINSLFQDKELNWVEIHLNIINLKNIYGGLSDGDKKTEIKFENKQSGLVEKYSVYKLMSYTSAKYFKLMEKNILQMLESETEGKNNYVGLEKKIAERIKEAEKIIECVNNEDIERYFNHTSKKTVMTNLGTLLYDEQKRLVSAKLKHDASMISGTTDFRAKASEESFKIKDEAIKLGKKAANKVSEIGDAVFDFKNLVVKGATDFFVSQQATNLEKENKGVASTEKCVDLDSFLLVEADEDSQDKSRKSPEKQSQNSSDKKFNSDNRYNNFQNLDALNEKINQLQSANVSFEKTTGGNINCAKQ